MFYLHNLLALTHIVLIRDRLSPSTASASYRRLAVISFKFRSVPPLLSITNGPWTCIASLNYNECHTPFITDVSKPTKYTKMIGFNCYVLSESKVCKIVFFTMALFMLTEVDVHFCLFDKASV